MDKIKKIIAIATMSLLLILINDNTAYAAGSFSVSGGGSVSAGGSITVSISTNNCAGVFAISADNGAVVSAGTVFVDGSGSVTVTAPSSGSFTVTVTASDVLSYDASPEVVSGSQSVSASVAAAVTTTPSTDTSTSTNTTTTTTTETTTEVVEDTRSTNNYLEELSVSVGTLSPSFDRATQEYTVSVENVDTIEVSATAEDSAASMTGTGEYELEVGENEISVVVTSEKGNYRTYVITVTKAELPTVYVTLGEVEYGVVSSLEDVAPPDGFEQTTAVVGGETVTAWTSNLLGLTLVYLSDADGNSNFYIYDEETGEIQAFRQLGLLGRNIYILEIPEVDQARDGMVYQALMIEGNEIMGWTFEDEILADYSIIHVMNDTGTMVDYLYSASDNAMVLAPDTAPVSSEVYAQMVSESIQSSETINTLNASLQEAEQQNTIYMYIIGGLGVLVLILIIILIVRRGKKSKAIQGTEDKDYYQNDEFEDGEDDEYDDESDEYEDELDDEYEDDTDEELDDEYDDEYEEDDYYSDDDYQVEIERTGKVKRGIGRRTSKFSAEIPDYEMLDIEL
ncbi:MAG: cadherin-like beta sandwich domain-containing protein [Eubacteriales bacterium]